MAVAALPQIFATCRDTETEDHEALKAALYQEIGQLKVELGRPLTDAPRLTRRMRS